MSLTRDLRAAVILTRPGQWSILATQFLVAVMLVSPAASGGGCWYNPASLFVLAAAAAVWVVLLNGGTLAFNSAYDKDTTPVAYLPDPPPPPPWLAAASTTVMVLGVAAGWRLVGSAFGLTVGVCVILSLLYSHPLVRLKARPGFDLAVNILGYGAGTTLAGILAGTAAHLACGSGACPPAVWSGFGLPPGGGAPAAQLSAALTGQTGWVILAFGLLFGSFYPLTQIYQQEDDRDRGDRTLATRLGTARALDLAFILGLLAAGALGRALFLRGFALTGLAPALALLLWQGHLLRWRRAAGRLTKADHEQHMYTALALWAGVDAALLIGWLFR